MCYGRKYVEIGVAVQRTVDKTKNKKSISCGGL
jgi:hypothetical protein